MHRIILLAAILATPAYAGGPVILETETPVTSDQRPCIIGCLALAVIVIGAAVLMGGDNCMGGETDGGRC